MRDAPEVERHSREYRKQETKKQAVLTESLQRGDIEDEEIMPVSKTSDFEDAKATLSLIFQEKNLWRGISLKDPPAMEDKDVEAREAHAQTIAKLLERFPDLASHQFRSSCWNNVTGYVPLAFLVCNNVDDEDLLERIYQICPQMIHQKQGEHSFDMFQMACHHGYMWNHVLVWLCSKFDAEVFRRKISLYPIFILVRSKARHGGFVSLELWQLFLTKFPVFTVAEGFLDLLPCLILLGYPAEVLHYVIGLLPDGMDRFRLSAISGGTIVPRSYGEKGMVMDKNSAKAVAVALQKFKTLSFDCNCNLHGNGWASILKSAAGLNNLRCFRLVIATDITVRQPEVTKELASFLARKLPSIKFSIQLEKNSELASLIQNYDQQCEHLFQMILKAAKDNKSRGPAIHEFGFGSFDLFQQAWEVSQDIFGYVSSIELSLRNFSSHAIYPEIMNQPSLPPNLIAAGMVWPLLSCLRACALENGLFSAGFQYEPLTEPAEQNSGVGIVAQRSIATLELPNNHTKQNSLHLLDAHHQRLTSLFILFGFCHPRRTKYVTPLLEETTKIKTLRSLRLIGNPYSGENILDADQLYHFLQRCTLLEKLELRGVDINSGNFQALPSKILKIIGVQHTELKEMYIECGTDGKGQVLAHGHAFSVFDKLLPETRVVDPDVSKKLCLALSLNRFGIQRIRAESNNMKRIELVHLLMDVRKTKLKIAQETRSLTNTHLSGVFTQASKSNLTNTFRALQLSCNKWCNARESLRQYEIDSTDILFGLLSENPMIWSKCSRRLSRKRKQSTTLLLAS